MYNEKKIIQWENSVDKSESTEYACKLFDDTCVLYLAWSGVNKTTREMWCVEFPYKYQVN